MDPNSFGNCKASRTLVSLIEGDRRMRRFVSDLWTQFNREIANNFYWSKERHHAEQVLGSKFNLRAFHDAILATGGVPLPVLDEYLEAWIKAGGIGPYPEMEK